MKIMKKIHKKELFVNSDRQLMKNIKNNLHVNDYISYKDLTALLNIKYISGKSKILQLKNLKRFISYEYNKKDKKYLITEIKSKYLQKDLQVVNNKYKEAPND